MSTDLDLHVLSIRKIQSDTQLKPARSIEHAVGRATPNFIGSSESKMFLRSTRSLIDAYILRGHLETHRLCHRLWQCQRCYVVCADMHELVHHRSEPCSENPPSPQEGIDDIQWERICVTLKAKKGLTGIYKLESERSKWFEMWDILFPTLSRPTHPCA